MDTMGLWQARQLGPDQCLRARIGPLSLWLRHIDDELHVATERAPDLEGSLELTAPTPADAPALDWGRWVVAAKTPSVQVLPVTPDRSVVVRPDVPIIILTHQEALFFVSFPIWVRVVVNSSPPLTVCEEPSIVLSNTWFGDPMLGELCYSLRSRARRRIGETEPRPHRAVCPVRIRNIAPEPLEVERFCLHVAHLSLYAGARQLWAGEVHVTFRGEGEVSQVDYVPGKPAFEAVDSLITEPREPLRQPLLKKSFSAFRLFGVA